jgi:outer membrane receptor protein involved in Fe transport
MVIAMPIELAHAQESRTNESRSLEEVVVTAQKREQSLQDVPISILVTTGEALEKQNLARLEDLTQQMPNVHVSRGTIADQLTIRGVGSGLNGGFEQSVGTYVDGVYHGRGHASQSSFVDVERLEVLRGPQSIYFGNNAIGGAFSVATRKPGDSWETQTKASYETEARESTIEVGTGGPVSDTLGLRVAARYSDMDGFLKNAGTGQRNPGIEDKFVRATLMWEPGDLWKTTL